MERVRSAAAQRRTRQTCVTAIEPKRDIVEPHAIAVHAARNMEAYAAKARLTRGRPVIANYFAAV
jgi:hypothetical protein